MRKYLVTFMNESSVMPYTVVYEPEAKANLRDIRTYITKTLHNRPAAQRFREQLDRRVGFLEDNPEIFAAATNPRLACKGYRTFAVGNYLAFYKVDHKAQTVRIMYVAYGKRDYIRHLP